MEIAVTGVKAVRAFQAIFLRQRFHSFEDLWELSARNGAVRAVVVFGDLSDRAKGRFATAPDALSFGLGGADADFDRPTIARNLFNHRN
jgi:hypothetical protein